MAVLKRVIVRVREAVRFIAEWSLLMGELARLLQSWNLVRAARQIVVMGAGGFGHTITMPEAARRLFSRERTVVLVFSTHPYHNPCVRMLWNDVAILWLSASGIGIRSARFVQGVLLALLSNFLRSHLLLERDLYALVEALRPMPEVASRFPSARWFGGYCRLLEEVSPARMRLPESVRGRVREAIRRFQLSCGTSQAGPYCCLYLRAKGAGSRDRNSLLRDGSPPHTYEPAVRFLTTRGYVVLLAGDRHWDRERLREFRGRVVDASYVSIDPRWYSLFAHTEASLWVGDPGGATWIPISNGAHVLIVNEFPYGFCHPRAEVLYKTVHDSAGHLVDAERLMREHAYDYDLRGMEVRANSAEAIEAAVTSFVLRIASASLEAPRPPMEFPPHAVHPYVRGRVSPTFYELYDASGIATKTV